MEVSIQIMIIQLWLILGVTPLFPLFLNPEMKSMSKKQLLGYWLCHAATLPLYFIISPFLRIPLTLLIITCSLAFFGRINLSQSMWISAIAMGILFLMDIVLGIITESSYTVVFAGIGMEAWVGLIQVILSQLIYMALVLFLIRKRVYRLILNKAYIKRYQITLSVVTIVVTVLIILFLLLTSPRFYYGDMHPVLFISFFVALMAAGVAAIVILDKYFKKIYELNLIKAQLSAEQADVPRRTPFEKSIEFELYNMDFPELFSDEVTIQNAIYTGPNSQIYVYEQLSDGKRFILKAMEKQPGIQYNFDVLSGLNHPNIAPMIKWREGKQYYFIVKEYADGSDAYSLVKENGPFGMAETLKIIKQLCEALSYLHSQEPPLICRDVKPNNIVLDEALKLSLIDIETLRKTSDMRDTDTFIVGTKGYAAPEQYGFSQTTAASDIFGIGATLYFLLTGEDPDHKRISLLHTLGDDELPSLAMKPLIPVIQKCMAFSPADRYASVDVLVEECEQLDY
ncbi:MAG: serine/threonine protein kinase [Firmicutes bacterium]|nr:serine/threonine protein kinase [Bacillota bacterium]